MAKPPFRDDDSISSRSDDMRVKAFGVEVEASGRIVVLLIIALSCLFLSAWAVLENSRAHERLGQGHADLERNLEIVICVLTLNEQERREFRTEGKYCPGMKRTVFQPDNTMGDQHQRFVGASP